MGDDHHKVVIACLLRLLKNYNYVVRALMIILLPCKRVLVNLDGINGEELALHEVTNWINYVAATRVEPSRVIYTAGYDPMCYYLLLVGSGEFSTLSYLHIISLDNMHAKMHVHRYIHSHIHTHTHTHICTHFYASTQ